MSNHPDLVPVLWNAPRDAYHLKPVNARHILARNNYWDAYRALPKRQRKSNLYICKRCGERVCWAEGQSGKRYLANVLKVTNRGYYRQRTGVDWYYNPADWHSKTCKPTADGMVHPNAVEHEERNARLVAERQTAQCPITAPEPYEPTSEEVRELHDELVAGAYEDAR